MSSDPDQSPIPLLDLREQTREIREELDAAIRRVMDSQRFVSGPEVEALEAELCEALGFTHAIGVSSGTDALLATLMALDIGPDDEVITTSFTFFATAGAIHRVGARPVFVDIEPDTFNLCPDHVEAAISPRTKAIVAVHLYGQCCRMDRLRGLAAARGLVLIEDAAQAIGARQHGVFAGNLGQVACFSFHPSKNLGAVGDAGLVATNDGELADRLRLLRQHGAQPKYHHTVVGGNFRMDELQAAVLRAKLPHLPDWNRRRQENASAYDELLVDLPLRTVPVIAGNDCVYQQYTVVLEPRVKRGAVVDALAQRGIASAVYYPTPLHLQPCFVETGPSEGSLPVAEAASRRVLSLPVGPELSPPRLARVAAELRRALASDRVVA
jgi:dTDP-4-amino-4,6-dideoxygalactose transaminase